MTDLHMHSTASDGIFTPTQLVDWATTRELTLMSLTDHDTIDGLNEMSDKCKEKNIKFIGGIEFSTYSKYEIHILGYNIDYLNPAFTQKLNEVKSKRTARNVELKNKLHTLGLTVDFDTNAKGVGRMNIARALVEQGFCESTNSAFEKYLGARGQAYTPSDRLKPFEAVQIINNFGGVAVIAHPKKFLQNRSICSLIEGLKKYGLKGIEVFYPSHNETDISMLKDLAKQYNLIMTGGSDFHGDAVYKYPEFDLDEYAKSILKI